MAGIQCPVYLTCTGPLKCVFVVRVLLVLVYSGHSSFSLQWPNWKENTRVVCSKFKLSS